MAGKVIAPFSARHRGTHARIDNDFPKSARIGLFHIVSDLVEKKFIRGWSEALRELQRIAREGRTAYSSSQETEDEFKELILRVPWQRALDFCERLYGRLPTAVGYHDRDNDWIETTSRADAEQFISQEIELLFLEEGLAFEFRDGQVQTRGRKHSTEQMTKADVVLGDPRLAKARTHYSKALQYFRHSKNPDPENAVKEAVCAVEAAAKALFPSQKGASLDAVIKTISGSEKGQLPASIAKTYIGLYGFRNSGDGVAHGAADGGRVTSEIAEFALAVAASQIILLVDLTNDDDDVPF